jgi:medium-chain acyl-[acyl-carrier-protein] hydrolase
MKVIESRRADGISSSAIYIPKPNSRADIRLFCFPYAGSGTLAYRRWIDDLSEKIELCMIRLPGRESRLNEPPFIELTPLVEYIAESIVTYLNKPFAFWGHSMGGLIAFELSRTLRRKRQAQPYHLFISGRGAPQLPRQGSTIHNLPLNQFIDKVRSLNGIPEKMWNYPEMIEMFIPILRADFAVCETYLYIDEPPLDSPITALGGLQDQTTSLKSLEAWKEQTSSSFTVEMFPGDHFYIHKLQKSVLHLISQSLFQMPFSY